jgi:YVTN family beta-propeller protein
VATHGALAAGVAAALLACAVACAWRAHASSPFIAISAVGRAPSAVVVDPRSDHVFVANSADNTVTMLDARTGRVLQLIGVGGDPDQLQVNPRTERAFVLNEGDGSVSVLDTRSGALLRTLQLGLVPAPPPDLRGSETFIFLHNRIRGSDVIPSFNMGQTGLVAVQDGPRGTRAGRPRMGWHG